MDQPKVARMLRLMQLLASNVNYSVDELMDKLEMSRRTIYRYIDTFKEAGFAVQKVGSSGTVYKIATLRSSQMDLSKIVYFSDEEAYVVNRLIDRLDDTNAMKQGLKRKLTAVYDATNIGNYIDKKSNSSNIEALTEAIRQKRPSCSRTTLPRIPAPRRTTAWSRSSSTPTTSTSGPGTSPPG